MARIDATLRQARARLAPDGGDADLLLAHVLGQSRSWLYAHGSDELAPPSALAFQALLQRRVAGEPVAYLVGQRGFWRMDLKVDAHTLIPRPETELLVELALARLPPGQPARVADLGTGSGAIALALALERPADVVVATDASPSALAMAQRNARELGLANVSFRPGDWLAPLAGEQFDLVASNPPYLADDDPHLLAGDLRFEPRSALASGGDGLTAIRAIARDAPACLVPGGWLLLEHGWTQGPAVRGLLQSAGFVATATHQDLEGRDRVTSGQWGGP